MTEREIARYRMIRTGLHMTAREALASARLYCSFTEEEHAASWANLDADLAAHTARVHDEGWTFMGVTSYRED